MYRLFNGDENPTFVITVWKDGDYQIWSADEAYMAIATKDFLRNIFTSFPYDPQKRTITEEEAKRQYFNT